MILAENDERMTGSIEVPAPTSWPLVAALGVTLGFAGLVTSGIVSLTGVVLALSGALGWWRDVLPRERVEHIPMRPRARAVVPATHAVEHLVAGEGGHRLRLPVEIHPYSAGLWGGIAGGSAMAALAVAYGLIAYGSLWYPINLLAAVAMPSLAQASTAQLASFSVLGFTLALIAHAVISLFVGLLYAVILPMLPRHPLWGAVVAPLLWSGLLWATLGVINPALDERVPWMWFIASQIAFGLTCGLVVARTERVATMQTLPLAARAGIEAPGVRPPRERE